MPLPQLFPGLPQVDVQQTAFSLDAVGRFACSTWDEATLHGGPPFTAVVVGAGMYGAYCAAKIVRLDPTARVLLLDAGRFLVSEHVQNLANIGFNVPGAIEPSSDPGVPRELVWGIPWRGNIEFPGVAYCTGGKSIYWGGWCPRLTAGDLSQWPAATAQYLRRSLHRRRERDRRRTGHRLHLRRTQRRAACRLRERRRGDARYRHVDGDQRSGDRATGGAR